MKKLLLFSLMFCFVCFYGTAQTTINWQTGSGTTCAGTGNGTMNATSDAACITINSLCRGTGINSASGGDFNSNGFSTAAGTDCASAIAADECLTWGFDVAAGCAIAAGTTMEFQLDRSNSGPPNFCLDMDSGAGFANLTSGAISASTGCINATLATEITGPATVVFRLCAWGASGATGTMDIEDGIASCGGAEGGILLEEPTPVPVELISFEGTAKNKNVDLSWSTASEENNSHFEIEYSTNGRDFTYIDKVVGVGTTAEIQNYQFTHTDAAAGKNYYRLRQVDFDGAFEYSSVAVVTMRTDAVIDVYPTMVASSVQVVLEKSLTTDVTLQVVDITGRQIQTGTIAKGTEQFELNVNDLDKGAYFIQFNVAGEVITRRFVKM